MAKKSKYTTIIASKEAVKRLSEARDKWKEEQNNVSQVGIIPFVLFLLDSYENQRK